MTVGVTWPYNSRAYDQGISSVNALPQRILGGAALAGVALACAWTLCVNLDGLTANEASSTRGDRLPVAAGRSNKLAVMQAPELASARIAALPFDSRFSAAFTTGVPESTFRLASVEQPDARQQGPVRRLARTESLPHGTSRARRSAAPAATNQQAASDTWSPPADHRSIFQRLFGTSSASPSIFAKLFGAPSSNKVELAYASADTDGMTAGTTGGLYDRQTAVYDISAHVVYLPNGTALEAHSGLGDQLDDPDSAHERNRGVTPPDVYTLRPREHLFHGVAALRLIPVDESKVFGRSGLLAHTFMLGPNGQSNGCVSFKDYSAFLQAYENGEITKLAVVAHL